MEELFGLLLLVLLIVSGLRAARATTALNRIADQVAALAQRVEKMQCSLDDLRRDPVVSPAIVTPPPAAPQQADLVQDERGAWVPRDLMYPAPPEPEPEPEPVAAPTVPPKDQIVGWDHGEPLYADEPHTLVPDRAAQAAPASEPPAVEPPPAPPRKRDFELSFGRRWTVLIGGGSVALGSILLVRYSITQGLFPPELRLLAAALFSAVMMAGAEVLRRRRVFGPSRMRALPDIPSTLFGAGAAGLFATVYAAHVVYGFVGAGTAFGAMAAIAIGGIAISLSYGPPLGVLGFAAAQVVPLLVGGGEPTLILPLYVSAVGAAALVVAQRGGWPWMEALAALGLAAWVLLLRDTDVDYATIVLVVLALGVIASLVRRLPRDAAGSTDRWAVATLALVAAGAWILAQPSSWAPDWLAIAIALTALLGVMALSASRTQVPAAGVLAGLALIAIFDALGQKIDLDPVSGLTPIANDWRRLVVLGQALVSMGLLGLAAQALWRQARTAPGAATWAIVGQVLAMAGIAFVLDDQGQTPAWSAAIAALSALGLLTLAWPRPAPPAAGREQPVVVAATGALALLALVPVILFSGPTLTLAFALVMLAAAGLAVLWQVASLVPVAAAAGLAILVHAAWQTLADLSGEGHFPGTDVVGLMLNSAVPGLLAAAAVLLLRRRLGLEHLREGDERWRAWLRLFPASQVATPPLSLIVMTSSASLLLLGGLGLAIRWLVFGNAYAPVQAPTDIGTLAAFVLGAATTALRLDASLGHRLLARTGRTLSWVGTGLVALAAVLNPFVASGFVGAWPILNLMLPAYLVPGLIGAAMAWRERDQMAVAGPAGGGAILGGFAWLSFSVAQAYQGSWIRYDAIGETELWTYTLVWLAYGLGLLMLGLRSRLRPLRLVAFAVMIGVTLKAFLIDMGSLTGVARALSFMALGLVLLGIGMFYQRLMTRQERAE